MLSLVASMFESGRYRLELETVKLLEKKQKEQFEYSQDTIDVINTKCHDLKKMLASMLGGDNVLTPDEVNALQEKISIYDSMYDTENKTLNTVLNEKSLYCEKNKIGLTVMASTPHLDFLTPMDIYSLFGNIIDNAIEAVMQLPESKRAVTLTVKEVKKMLIIHEENYYGKEPKIDGKGNLLTAKRDKNAHGYGILSMRRVVEKYGGALKINASDGVFSLDILIPVTDTAT